MKAVMLAAGVGRRLYGDGNAEPPKALLQFGGQSLLRRHLRILVELGVEELVVVVGHRREMIEAELASAAPAGFSRTLFNPRYPESPILSLATASDVLRAGSPILFMDADVYYHPDLMRALIRSPKETCILMDRDFVPGAEPVKVCVKNGVIVDFGKKVTTDYDTVGEWPGFLKMAPDIARRVADRTDEMARGDMPNFIYEQAFCEIMQESPSGTFGVEDVTGIPWIEIDFPEDVARAEQEIQRKIAAYKPISAAAV